MMAAAITSAIESALTQEVQDKAAERETPYGQPGGSDKIARSLIDLKLDGILIKQAADGE